MSQRQQFLVICFETGYFERYDAQEAAVATAAAYARKYEAEVTILQTLFTVRIRTEWNDFSNPDTTIQPI